MSDKRSAAFFFCMDASKDAVAPRVFYASQHLVSLKETDMTVDGFPVLLHMTDAGDQLFYVRTDTVLCMAFDRYITVINQMFSQCELAVLINWHGGANAPDQVLCIHTVGDVESGTFGSSSPQSTTNLARQLEKCRVDAGLEEFKVTSEGTHWSGVVYGGDVRWIRDVQVPFLDLEIGSTAGSYENPKAAAVIAQALSQVFEADEHYPVLLYCGGTHFEDTITQAILHPSHPVALTHILPSRWMETPIYSGQEGHAPVRACIASIRGGIDGFVVHEKLSKEQREMIGTLAAELGLPVIRRKALKNMEQALDALL